MQWGRRAYVGLREGDKIAVLSHSPVAIVRLEHTRRQETGAGAGAEIAVALPSTRPSWPRHSSGITLS
ncbi:hypothetical protein BV25DRAFT_1817344 [Artomyces pyxidatus]|uniref:Uncharacterized protein n=1 Tax=Artomyces pyxidatus TaxID=48021 RepID=A0ACB8TJ84_9AGAM|nr:hypothetical protein BV25DRAFT_1817344 [Artomyces pyxidatus]